MVLLVIGEKKLSFSGFDVVYVDNITRAMDFLCSGIDQVCVIFVDILDDWGGLMHCLVLERMRLPVVVYGEKFDPDLVYSALNAGAVDYCSITEYPESLGDMVNAQVENSLGRDFVFVSEEMNRFVQKIRQLTWDQALAIRGHRGIGKTALVNFMAKLWNCHKLVVHDLSVIPREMLESTLFGHKGGHFGGSLRDRAGAIEQADKGMVVLKQAEVLDGELLKKVLEAFKSQTVTRIGDSVGRPVKFRLSLVHERPIDLPSDVCAEIFPPFQNRREDMNCIFRFYVDFFCKFYGLVQPDLSPSFVDSITEGWGDDVASLVKFLKSLVLSHSCDVQQGQAKERSLGLPLEGLDAAIEAMKSKISYYRRYKDK